MPIVLGVLTRKRSHTMIRCNVARIALISLHFSEYALRLAKALSLNNEVLLILDRANTNAEIGSEPCSEGRLHIRHYDNCGIADLRFLRTARTLVKDIVAFGPDIIHCQETFKDYQLLALSALRRFPALLTIHDFSPHPGRDAKLGARRNLYRRILRAYADAFLVHGETIAKKVRTWDEGRRDVFVVPHGVLGSGVVSTGGTYIDRRILFFGRIEEYKGLKVLLHALGILRSRGVSFRAIVAGKGPDLDSCRRLILENDWITLLEGFIPPGETENLFRSAHVVVLPYIEGSQSGVAALAIGYGRPVIATDVGAIPEMVRHEHNGLLVPPNDPISLSESIARVLTDRGLTTRLEQGAALAGRGDLSWENIAARTTIAYEIVASQMRR